MSELHTSSSWATSTLPEPSPPSTPSLLMSLPIPPPYNSLASHESSSLMYSSLSKPQPLCEDGTDNQLASQQNSKQNYMSPSCGPCHGGCKPAFTNPDMAPIPERVSLQQHMQHADIGREEAMQSFILERFLPAAKAVATDHDRTFYVATKQDARKQSSTHKQSIMPPHMYMPKSSRNTSRLQRSITSTSTSSISKGAPWSSPLSQDRGELEYSDDEEPIKSNGFCCVGLKTAISRVHKVVHASTHSMSRSKARTSLLSKLDASSIEEEDVFPKVQILAQGMQTQWNGHTPTSYTSSSTSPTADNIYQGSSSRFVAPNRNNLSQSCMGPDGKPSIRPISLDGTSLQKNCHSVSHPHHDEYRCNSPKQHQSYARCLSDQCSASDHWDGMAESPGGSRLEEASPVQNTSRCSTNDDSTCDVVTRASSKGSIVHCNAAEISMSGADSIDNDEQFHDAFDSWSSIAAAPLTCPSPNVWSSIAGAPLTCTSPNSPDIIESTIKRVSDEDGVVDLASYFETPHASDLTGGISGCITKSEGLPKYVLETCEERESKEHGESGGGCALAGSAHDAAGKQKHGKVREIRENQGQEKFPRTLNDTHSSKPSSNATVSIPKCHQSATPARHRSCVSPQKPGWPLGISGIQLGTKKPSPQEETAHANLVPSSTESSVLSSPPVPPSPTGSWLGKAMALNASKPSTLSTLQQKEKAVSARKKLEFTPSDKRKEVKWEDMVKGSQMHPEQFSFSEELRHGHPSNRNVIRPLRL